MAELKTQKTTNSVLACINAVEHVQRRNDAKVLLKLMKAITGKKPAMWGASIVGFDSYHYKSERSTQEGDWFVIGFSPRKTALSVYVCSGFKAYPALMKKLGTYKVGVGCLYIKKMEDVDMRVLEELLRRGYADAKKMYEKK